MRRFAALFVAGLTCCLQGCVLGVGWLPDSSGFVYTSAKGDLLAYDVAGKKSRVILNDPAAATTCWPAVSADGKRIALAHLGALDGRREALVQFVICDLQGKIEQRSDKLRITLLRGKGFRYSTQVSWSPDGKKILVHCQGLANEGMGFDSAALFDVAGKKLQVWDKHVPAYFGGSPVRPDGAGFLLGRLRSNDDVDEYAWVEWTGKEKRIAVKPKGMDDAEPLPPWTALFDSRWDGAKAVLLSPTHRYVVDTKTLEHSMQAVDAKETKLGKETIRMRARLQSGIELLLLDFDDGRQNGSLVRLVSRKKGEAAVTEIIAPIRDRMIVLDPAPDAKHAIVRIGYGYRGEQEDTIHILDNAGRLQDTINVISKKE